MKKNFEEFKQFIKNKKTAVVGIGVSNIPLIYFLIELGAKVTAFDKKTEEQLGNTAEELKRKNVNLELGESYLDNLKGFEVIFKSPSMRIDSKTFIKAKEEGAYITSEMEEFVRYCPGKIYGITGSDGKTTTTSIVYNLLKEQGYNTWVGGNIGNPLFSNIEEIKEDHKVVLELSSFQLMTMDSPIDTAIVTNITPNHLDMHKDMQEYIDSKKNIFKYQGENGLLILNRENDITNSFVKEANGRAELFSSKRVIENGAYYNEGKLYLKGKEVCSKDEIVIQGMHNIENYLAAFLAVQEEVDISTMKKVASTFNGVAHRNEFVREVDGVRYYNDSIGSSPTRTIATISVFSKPVILIAGGYDKNIPFEPLAEKGYDKIKALILMGVTKNKIKKVFDKVIKEKNLNIPIYMAEDINESILKAKEIAQDKDIVVLSPACASFDMFPNFEKRGEAFRKIVNSL
ncbi:UDP-N-acetylmuramoyl-L-alanine--D-glutamate ligase [Clostridium polynesiense]|uniref:UDP-N-acetylmuramoyl-L-alanine--D-glutamate ligase n=1 Tax=Clostridium polynesiense TaxID=1325933 RepID=UPI00058F19F9|nr:UDP-N-acetylmuramoyl-L-alanine--D-glutamate ligase [Clostridium polynesiense]